MNITEFAKTLSCEEAISVPLAEKKILNSFPSGKKRCSKCDAEIDPFLAPAGFASAKWISHHGNFSPVCDKCRRKEENPENQNSSLLEKFAAKVSQSIPPRFYNADIAGCPQKIKDYYLSEKWKKGTGLFLFGGPGVGKTYSLCSLAKLMIANDCEVLYCNMTKMLNRIKGSYGNKDGEGNELIDRAVSCDVLIIDDFGLDKLTEFVADTIYYLVNERYDNMKAMIISSNMGLGSLDEKIGERIASRIKESCDVLKMEGRNRRLP